jgi:hypothetical protein
MGSVRNSFWTNNAFDEATGCWNWTGVRIDGGYGRIVFNGNRHTLVHRLSAHLYLGFDLKSKLLVCHRCDNPSCFNPKHLFIGTNLDNMKDAVAKGRFKRNNANSRKTHCPQGHPYLAPNLWVSKKGIRQCRACHDLNATKYRQAKEMHTV